MGSDSESEKTTTNTTNVSTTTTTAIGGPALTIQEGGKFRGDVGLTGDAAVSAIAAFSQGAVELERARNDQIKNIFSGLGTLASQRPSSGSGAIYSTGGGGGDGEDTESRISPLVTVLGGIAAISTVLFLSNRS